ncbi:MAG: nucleoside triphosphate pyrophosphohydrolase [Candidatus Acidiferrum sp.]
MVAVQARLRAPDGCPWDRQQTHATLRTYLIEEAYEVLEALESGDDAKFTDEMGDLLLQILFHSQIASETRRFDVTDVIRAVHDKMIRRHPHVFGETRVINADEVLKNWEQIKKEERNSGSKNSAKADSQPEKPSSLLDGISRALPATLEAFQLTRRAARIGFDWEDSDGIFDKTREELAELRHAVRTEGQERVEEELGDVLFSMINLARFLRIDPEIALKKANSKFQRRFQAMEAMASAGNRELSSVPRSEMEVFWDSTKRAEAPGKATARPAVAAKHPRAKAK